MADQVKHPAKFNDTILEVIANLLPRKHAEILDPFAGVGRVHDLREKYRWWHTWGLELESEWATQSVYTQIGDALAMPFQAEDFDAIVTSPCYGNRMADNYAGDGTPRHTYRIDLV